MKGRGSAHNNNNNNNNYYYYYYYLQQLGCYPVVVQGLLFLPVKDRDKCVRSPGELNPVIISE